MATRKKRTKAKVGDVFRVSVSETRSGFGQVLADRQGELLIVIYSLVVGNHELPSMDAIVCSEPLFIAISLDAMIWDGTWPIVGNTVPDHNKLPLPKYKVTIGGSTYVESFNERKRRPATDSEVQLLPSRAVYSPQVLEDALKDHCGTLVAELAAEQPPPGALERLRAECVAIRAEPILRSARVVL